MKILALIGNTASGKSTLQDNLIKEFPDKYETVGQFTTRYKRSKEESNLIYITEEQYNTIKSNLVGKCSFNNNYYGSLLCNLDNNKIKIVTVTIEGYIDLLNNVENLNSVYTLVLLNNNFTDALSIRKNRSLEFLEQEYKEIKDYVYNIENMKDRGYFIMDSNCKQHYNIKYPNNGYPNVELVDSLCSKYFSNKEQIYKKNDLLSKINLYLRELGGSYFSEELSCFMNDYSEGSKLFSFNLYDFEYEDKDGEYLSVFYEDLDIGDISCICDILSEEYYYQLKTLERCKD